VAHLFLCEGKQELALELLAGVMHYAGEGQERQSHALALLPACEAGLAPQVVAKCHELGKAQTLADMAARVMGERPSPKLFPSP
jgi:hypothetical protein